MRRYLASEMEGIQPYEAATTVHSSNPTGGWNDVATRLARLTKAIPQGTHLRVRVRPGTVFTRDDNGNVAYMDDVSVSPKYGLAFLELSDRLMSETRLERSELDNVIVNVGEQAERRPVRSMHMTAFLSAILSMLRFLPYEPEWHRKQRDGRERLADKEWAWLRRAYTDGHDPVDGEPFYVRDACKEVPGYRAILRSAERQMRGMGKGTIPLYDPMGNEIGTYVHRGDDKAGRPYRRRLDADVASDGTYLGDAKRGDSSHTAGERMRSQLSMRNIG